MKRTPERPERMENDMTLDELIAALEAMPQDLMVTAGFSEPQSWRGIYAELAFAPTPNRTVAEMLADAKSAKGSVYEGYKGGAYRMSGYTDVHLAEYGRLGEPITQALIDGWVKDDTITRLTRERDDLRVDAEVLDARLDSMREERDEAVAGLAWVTSDWTPVEDATCPVCGGMVKWSCGTGKYPHGRAECQDGRRVSRRWPGEGEPCVWHGAPTVRVRGSIRVNLTYDLGELAEVRALADAYIDIVNRTARALGIPEVDEDGAMPSLHDVPERVAEVVHLAAVLRDPRILRRIDDVREGGGTSAANDLAADLLSRIDAPASGQPERHVGRGVLNIVFSGEPHDLSFVEAETADGRSVRAGRWLTEGSFSVLALDSLFPVALVEEPTDDDATQDPPGWGDEEAPNAR